MPTCVNWQAHCQQTSKADALSHRWLIVAKVSKRKFPAERPALCRLLTSAACFGNYSIKVQPQLQGQLGGHRRRCLFSKMSA